MGKLATATNKKTSEYVSAATTCATAGATKDSSRSLNQVLMKAL